MIYASASKSISFETKNQLNLNISGPHSPFTHLSAFLLVKRTFITSTNTTKLKHSMRSRGNMKAAILASYANQQLRKGSILKS